MQVSSVNSQFFAAKNQDNVSRTTNYAHMDYSKLDDKKMREVAGDFESLFINELFKSMRKTVPENEWLDGGMKQDIFEDMLYNEYAKNFSSMGGIGLGKMVYDYLKQNRQS